MDRRLGYLLLAGLLLVAGCIAPVSGGERAAQALEPTVTPAEPAGGPTSSIVDGGDPNAVVISVEAAGDRSPPVESVVSAANYWERDATSGNQSYVVRANARDADVVLRVADDPLQCESGDARPDFFCLQGAGETDASDPPMAVLSPGLTDGGYESVAAAALGRIAGEESPLARPDLTEPTFANPWPASDPVTVRIDPGDAPDRTVEPLVRETLEYWEEHDDQWGTYTADWEIVDDPDADVTVSFVDEIRRCGDHPDPANLIGCAPVRDRENLADGDERVRISTGYDDATTRFILKHEFGHLYGLSHDDEPADVMVDRIPTTDR